MYKVTQIQSHKAHLMINYVTGNSYDEIGMAEISYILPICQFDIRHYTVIPLPIRPKPNLFNQSI